VLFWDKVEAEVWQKVQVEVEAEVRRGEADFGGMVVLCRLIRADSE